MTLPAGTDPAESSAVDELRGNHRTDQSHPWPATVSQWPRAFSQMWRRLLVHEALPALALLALVAVIGAPPSTTGITLKKDLPTLFGLVTPRGFAFDCWHRGFSYQAN